MASSVASFCECVNGQLDDIAQLPVYVRPSYLQTEEAGAYATDALMDTVSSTLARIGSVLVIRGVGDRLSYDPYGQCHTVRLIAWSLKGDDRVYAKGINDSLSSCKLPYVERFDVDISGLKHDHNIDFSTFIHMYDSTLREVRVVYAAPLLDTKIAAVGYGRLFDTLRLLSNLERLTLILEANMVRPLDLWTHFFVCDLPYLPNLIHLRLQALSFGSLDETIYLSAPSLQTLVLEEAAVCTGIISLDCLTRLKRLSISSAREVAVSNYNLQLKFIELHRVRRLYGDIRSISVANFASCPADIVEHLLGCTTTRENNPLRHLGLYFIDAPNMYINADGIDVLFLANVAIACIVNKHTDMKALYVHNVRLTTASSSLRVKHLLLSGYDSSNRSFISNAGIQAELLQSLAFDLFSAGNPSGSDLFSLFACFFPSPQPLLPMPDLKFMAATTVAGSYQLARLLRAQQLDVFAFAQVRSEAVQTNRDILAVSKLQTECEDVSQFWYEHIGFETALVHGANKSWSFLLSPTVRKILEYEEDFVEHDKSQIEILEAHTTDTPQVHSHTTC